MSSADDRRTTDLPVLAIGAIGASLAHELNNPLSSIIGNLEFAHLQVNQQLRDHPAAIEVRELLEEAMKGAEKLRLMVDELRTLADDGPQGAADVADALGFAERLAKSRLRERARLVIEPGPTLPATSAAFGLVTQLLLCALLDAARALPSDTTGHAVRIRSSTSSDQAVVEVTRTRVEAEGEPQASALTSALARRVGVRLDVEVGRDTVETNRGDLPCVTTRMTFPAALR